MTADLFPGGEEPGDGGGAGGEAGRKILRESFGYDSFRPGQEEAINAILARQDVLAVMPTGAGKSLCYQIPALMLPGMTLVISPLISLMKDQVQALNDQGIAAAFLNSSLELAEYRATMDQLRGGEVKLLYVAPERLQREDFSVFLADFEIPLVVVDEAHCVSQWGHDFRPGYLDIAPFIGGLPSHPVTAAFTATATPQVREDILQHLALAPPPGEDSPRVITTGFDRPNLYFEVKKAGMSVGKGGKIGRKRFDKPAVLLECLAARKDKSGIIYCATRRAVEEVFDLLATRGFPVTRYHAGLSDRERRRNQEDFIYDRRPIMVATNAFGMGIDKSNVSFVIHYNMPKNIESYYQEAGRAGRDGAPADCILLYSGSDVRIAEFLITRRNEEGEEPDPALVEHNLELLRQMTFYATGTDCLRGRLLAYFGETPPAYCGNCSNCLTVYEEADVSLEAQKILSCVYRLRERGRTFGRTMITDILRGRQTEKIQAGNFQTLSTWGLMADASSHRIRVIMDFLLDGGYLAQRSTGEYSVIELGPRAGAFLKSKAPLIMMLPQDTPAPEPGASPEDFVPAAAASAVPGSWERRPRVRDRDARTSRGVPAAEGYDEALFERLRARRSVLAAEAEVPAYIVFSDASLRDMSRKKPVTLDQFLNVTGVGQAKRDKYGPAFTALIREYLDQRGPATDEG